MDILFGTLISMKCERTRNIQKLAEIGHILLHGHSLFRVSMMSYLICI